MDRRTTRTVKKLLDSSTTYLPNTKGQNAMALVRSRMETKSPNFYNRKDVKIFFKMLESDKVRNDDVLPYWMFELRSQIIDFHKSIQLKIKLDALLKESVENDG